LGATKIALGHHRDDMLETMFLNMFYGGKMKSMPPKLVSDNGEHIVIRPLAYCREKDIEKYSIARQFPIIPCNLCGSQDGLQRQVVKDMLQDWDKRFPGRIETMFQAMQNIVPSHMIDKNLFNFAALTKDTELNERDTAFDKAAIPAIPVGLMDSDDAEPQQDTLQVIAIS
ncbi:MAG: ATP-binding protein, partial [Rheinheimera sp.]|nr:ATP-binding protein [Rheinheimera sp.]